MMVEDARRVTAMVLAAYICPLGNVPSFKYIGRILSALDDDWPVVIHNIRKSRKKWSRLLRVMGRDGVDVRPSGLFYIEVVQAVPMYGSETWFMSPCIGRMLVGFHHRVVSRLTGQHTRSRTDGMWVLLPLEEAMMEVDVQEVETYAAHRQNTAT